jgi:hypothetical protein
VIRSAWRRATKAPPTTPGAAAQPVRRVSVIVPTLNQGQFLEFALQSIVAQRTPVELIVVDGGSTDGTVAIIERWRDRIAWWRSGPDGGQSAAINEGMRHATAPYVTWMNSDDWYLSGGLDVLVEALEANPSAPGVYGDAVNANESGRLLGRYLTQAFTQRNLALRCFISQPATLLRRSTWDAVRGVDESLHYAMDYDLWWRIFRRFGPLLRVRQDVAVNRRHAGTKTGSARRAQTLEAVGIVERNVGYVPMKWYVAWPYSVWFKSLANRIRYPGAKASPRLTQEGRRGAEARRPKALIVKLAAIGDVVMALPMITAIRADHPDARITWACGVTVAPLLRCVDGIDECLVLDDRGLLAGSAWAKARAVMSGWRRLAWRRFDRIYIAHSDARYRLLALPAIASLVRSLGRGRSHRALVPRRAHVDEYVRLVTGLDDYRARDFPAPALRCPMPDWLEATIDGFARGRRVVAIVPGGARNVARENPLRRWPLDRYARLAAELDARGYAVVVTGDSMDEWVRPAFGACVLDLVGRTDLADLVALFRRCHAVVAHDTGPLHLARLASANVVALLGPTPPSMFFREETRTTVLWPGRALPCAPCYDGVEFANCGNNVCMQMIGCREVMDVVDTLLPAADGRQSAALAASTGRGIQ